MLTKSITSIVFISIFVVFLFQTPTVLGETEKPIIIHTDKAPKVTGPFSQAMRAGDFLFLQGMRGIDPKTNQIVPDIDARVKQIFENIKAILEAAGASLENVVSTRVYVRDMYRQRPIVNKYYEIYFGKKFPPRTIVEISRLNQDDDVEIEVFAWVPKK